jgi:putative ABC transport system permease protein
MANFVTSLYRMFYEFPDLENQVYLDLYAGGMAVAMICALVGSLHGARAALRLKPAAAMRPKPPAQGGAIWLEHVDWLWRRLSFGWRLVLRNVFRNRLRSTVGVFATAMGAGLLVNGFILANAITYLISFQFERVTRSDLDLHFKDERGLAALLESRRLPGVDYAEPIFDVSCTFVHGPNRHRGGISGLVSDSRLTTPRDTQGRPIRVPDSGLAMSRKLAQLLNVAPGDQITVLPTRGLRHELTMCVAALSDSYIGMAVYADIRYLSRTMNEEFAINGVQMAVDRSPGSMKQLYAEIKQLPAVQAVNARADTIENLEFIVETQRIFIMFLVVFAGVIFFSSLLNSSLIGLAERRREVATLRVLGYTPWQVGGLFLRESLVINSLGTLVGLPLGYGLALVLSKMYDTEMFRFPLITPPKIWLSTVAMAAVFALVAHVFVQSAIHRLDWLDASKTQE